MEKQVMIEMLGRTFGHWTVLSRAEADARGQTMWLCGCACGKEKAIRGSNLRDGKTQSCGCIRASGAIHGLTVGYKRSPTYNSWQRMLERCLRPYSDRFSSYGAKGVTVCDGLREIKNFLAVLGVRPAGTTLGRFGDTGNYSCGNCPQCKSNGWPLNCAWQSDAEQKQTARTKRLLKMSQSVAVEATA